MQIVYPVLKYEDAHAAIEFLEKAFGVERLQVYDQGLGRTTVYVVVDEVDPLFERARDAGAEVVLEPTDQDYGSRDFTVRDPEGNLWSFGTYAPALDA